jgi:ELWxxDGT repeat protein
VRYLAIFLAAAYVASPVHAQSAFRVANLTTAHVEGKVSPAPPIATVGDRLVFNDRVLSSQSSMWSTDGTQEGLVQITDGITPLSSAEMGGILYFLSGSELGPHGLWRTDGTQAGTWLLRWFDRPFPLDSASAMVAAGDQVFFFGYDPEHGQELWRSDGTVPGTVLAADLIPGSPSSFVLQMVAFHDEVYFIAQAGGGFGLWRSNGVLTTLVADVGSYQGLLGATSRYVFYTVGDTELWRTDGTERGTMRLRTFVEDETAPHFYRGPSNFLDLNGTALFVANDGTTGRELWRSDGTLEGTLLVKDIHPGDAGVLAWISPLTKSGARAYFSADDSVHGQEIWTTDGTADGTRMVRDIRSGSDPSMARFPEIGAGLGGAFFSADDGVHGVEPWRSDGTEEGTALISDIQPGAASSNPDLFLELDGDVYFAALAEGGYVLWRTDGTESGTSQVDQSSRDASSFPASMTDVGGTTFFVTSHDRTTFDTLWRSDGTEEGTGPARGFCSIFPPLQSFRDDLYFIAGDCLGSQLVWTPDGTLKEIPDGFVTELVTAGDALFFWNKGELWRSDGSSDGTLLLRGGLELFAGPGPLVVALPDGLDYFVTHGESGADQLWRTDGTPESTESFASPGPLFSRLSVVSDRLIFAVLEGPDSLSIWTSDGTGPGTSKVVGLTFATDSFLVFTVSGGLAYFVDHQARELWRTDGTAAGTVRVAAIDATSLTDVGGVLFFAGDDGVHGEELWTSDGTPGGTRMVRDIWPGPIGSSPTSLRNVDGILVFAAHDGVNGSEPWRSDGTKPGTYILADVNPGIGSSDPADFARSGDLVFFGADDGLTGRELWAISASAVSEITGPRRPPARVVSPRH